MPAESQDRLRLVVDAIPALVSYVDTSHSYRLVNAAYEQWFGFPRAEVEGRHLREVLGEVAYQAVLPFIDRALAGEALSYETVAPYRHGGTRHIHASYVPHRDGDGRVIGFVALVEDVTSRKRAEEELASVRAETSKILASVTDAFCAFDREFRYTYLNRQAEQYLGRPKEVLLGRVLWEAFPETEGTASLERLRGAMAQRKAQHFEMLSAITGRWIEVDAYPYEEGLALLFRDITERKQAEAALRDSEERLRAALKSAPIAVFNQDLDLRYTWVHDTGRGTAGDVLGRSDAELWERPEEREALSGIKRRVLESGTPDRQEVVLHTAGERRVYDLALEPLRDQEGRVVGLTGAAMDVTERKHIEDRLRQSAKMEAIGRLAGGLAHDFNNQLHALSGFADFVARDPGLGPRTRHDLLEIQRIAERMAGLTRQLLAFSRQQVLVPETLNLNAAIGEARAMLQRLIGRSIETSLHPAPVPVWVRVDRSQLLQVLMNLAINGRDAMPTGGSLVIGTGYRDIVRGEPDPGADGSAPIPPGRYAALSVTDTGSGIAPEHLPHIFEPFFTTKEVGQGTGLGLATVHGIVSQSQGHIRVRTEPGRGTTFEILLPEAEQPDPRLSGEHAAADGETTAGRILVVDDEDLVRAVIARALEEEGFRVVQARHGAEALEWLRQLGGAIDLVVSDVAMPVMGGAELARRLAAGYGSLPVVWISGHPRDTAPGGAAFEGPFLQKPVAGDLLVDTVRRLLGTNPVGQVTNPEAGTDATGGIVRRSRPADRGPTR